MKQRRARVETGPFHVYIISEYDRIPRAAEETEVEFSAKREPAEIKESLTATILHFTISYVYCVKRLGVYIYMYVFYPEIYTEPVAIKALTRSDKAKKSNQDSKRKAEMSTNPQQLNFR